MKKITAIIIFLLPLFSYCQQGLYEFNINAIRNPITSAAGTTPKMQTNNATKKKVFFSVFKGSDISKDSLWANAITKINNLSGIASEQTGSITNEWLADGFGKWRMSAGSGLAIGSDSSVKTYQEFINGGGNLFVKAVTPAFILGNNDKRYLAFFFAPRVGLGIPGLGTTLTDSLRWTVDGAFELQMKVGGDNGKISFFGILRGGYAYGSNAFTKDILENSRNFFGYAVTTFGFTLNNSISIQITAPFAALDKYKNDPIDRAPTQLTFALLTK